VEFTVGNMPRVRTPIVAPTKIYGEGSLIEPEQAASLVCKAICERPARLVSPLGKLAQLLEVLAPQVKTALNAENFRMFPESEAAGGPPGSDRIPPETSAFLALMRAVEH